MVLTDIALHIHNNVRRAKKFLVLSLRKKRQNMNVLFFYHKKQQNDFEFKTPPHLSLRQLDSELLHLLPELPDDASVGVFVHHGVVHDPLGPVGVAERGQSLLIVVCRRAHCGDHGRLAVAAQVVLHRHHFS